MDRPEQLVEVLDRVKELYHRLILVVAPAGGGKTAVMRKLVSLTSMPLINVNLELSRRLLDLTERQRALETRRLLEKIMDEVEGDLVLLDNIEILFDIRLKQDPLRLLQGLSRNKTVVAAWNGLIVDGHLTYATPDNPEYRRYPIGGFLVVGPEVTV